METCKTWNFKYEIFIDDSRTRECIVYEDSIHSNKYNEVRVFMYLLLCNVLHNTQ